VCSNICDVTYIGGSKQRLLRRFAVETPVAGFFERVANPIYYLPTVIDRCSEIQFSIYERGGVLAYVRLKNAVTSVMLHFKRHAYTL
jgi:hypothetical protein